MSNTVKSEALTLMLLLDAFRPDYLQHTPYIRTLAQKSTTGTLRECFGFLPRAAYFGGLDCEQSGFTNMYCFDPKNSVFGSAHGLAASKASVGSDLERELRRAVEDRAREKLPAFAKAYASSAQIPLPYLPYFDLVERRAPWDQHAGYESLFHLLNSRGIKWHQCSWPETNRLSDHSDKGIVRHTLSTLRPEHQFLYVHLQELDAIGHCCGPNSIELQKRLRQTDNLCKELIESARKGRPAFNVILFGDHGMVNVTNTLNLTSIIANTRLRFGSDFGYFLDSTMARFWFFHRGAEAAIREALAGVKGGRLLSTEEMKHFGILKCDRRNGELIFLANPGVLLFPNFFQFDGEPIKGMHGYDPDCQDNLGLFLLHSSKDSQLVGQELGKVNPHQIYEILKSLMGLGEQSVTASLTVHKPASRGRFTSQTSPEADATVQNHMELITNRVRQQIGSFEAIVLTGSFGRGEGGVYKNGDGNWHVVNDYDLFVVSSKDCRSDLNALSESLTKELGLDYLDLGWVNGQWAYWPLTVANYDLKHGSQVIAGNPDVLASLPAYASAELPIYEAVKLLLNRTAGLLSGLNGTMFSGDALSKDQRRYLTNQIAKAQMALGDSYLIRWGGYDSSYRLRRERFAALAPGAGLAENVIQHVTSGYDFKLNPTYDSPNDPLKTVQDLQVHLQAAVIETVSLLGNEKAFDLAKAMDLYVRTMNENPGWAESDNILFIAHNSIRPFVKQSNTGKISLRYTVYSALPEMLASAFSSENEQLLSASKDRLSTSFDFPETTGNFHNRWEMLRARTVAAWFAVHH